MLPRLVGKPAQAALDSLDISLTDNSGNLKDIISVYTEVANKVKGISDSERIAVTEGLAGKFHISRMQALLDDLGSADSMYRKMEETSKTAAGSAMTENEEYMKSLQARMGLARVEVEKLALSIGEAFLTEGMIQGIKMFADVLEAISSVVKVVGFLPAGFALAGLALTLLSTKFKGLTVAISQSILGMMGFRTATTSTGAASATLGARLVSLGASMKTFIMSTGLAGIAFVAVGFAIEKVMGIMGTQREAQEAIERNNRELASSYKENGEEIKLLASRYETLQDIMRTGTEKEKTEVADEYLAVQNKLAELMPNLSTGEDEYGNAVLGNATILENRIKLIEKQIEAEEKLQDVKNADKEKKEIKVQEDNLNLGGIGKDYQIEKFNNRNNAVNEHLIDQYKEEIKSYEDMTAAIKHYEEESAKYAASGDTTRENYANKRIAKLQKIASEYIKFSDNYNAAEVALASSSFESTEKIINDNDKLSDSTKEMATTITSTIATLGIETGALGNIFSGITDGLGDGGQLGTFIDEYTTAFSRLEKAQKDGLKPEELDNYLKTAQNSFGLVRDEVLQTAIANGVLENSVEYADLEARLISYGNANLVSAEFVSKLALSTGQSTEQIRAQILATSDGTMMMEDFEESTDGVVAKQYELKDAIDQMSGVAQQQIDDTETMTWQYDMLTAQLETLAVGTDAYNEVNGRLIGVKEQLLALYPHLFAADQTAEKLTYKQIEAIKQEVEANDILRAAYKASRDGKLTSDEDKAISGIESAKTEIHNINEQIKALNRLAAAYRAFSEKSIALAQELKNAGGLDDEAEDAFIQAQKWKGFADKTDANNAAQLGIYEANLAGVTKTQKGYIDTLKKSEAVMGNTTTSANKLAGAKDKKAKSTKDATKAEKAAAKAMEESIFIADKYKRALELLNLEIKKQQDIQSNTSSHTNEHQKALQTEIKLQHDKKTLLIEQAKALEAQIKAGKILQTGVVTTSSDGKSQKLSGWGGSITSQFGNRKAPIKGASTNHQGIDISGKNGTRVDSNVSGTVTFAGNKGNGLGNYVAIKDASGNTNIYGHLQDVLVKAGQSIAEGVGLGTIGSTGTSTGNHLHYQVNDSSGKAVNPASQVESARKGNSTASKDAAQVLSNIDAAKSELIALEGQIMEQDNLIAGLETKYIGTELDKFNHKRETYQRILDFEAVKMDTLDKTSQRYVDTLARNAMYLEKKQSVNQEELTFLEELRKSGKLSAIAMDENAVRIDNLKTTMLSDSLEIQQTNADRIDSIMGGYAERIDDLDYAINRSKVIQSLYEEGTAEYANEVKNQIDLLQSSQKEISNRRDELKELIRTEDLSIEKVKEYKEELEDLSIAYWNVSAQTKSLKDATNAFVADSLSKMKDEYINGLKKESEEIVKSIEGVIKATEDQYDSLIEKQKERLSALDEEIEKEDRLKKLQEIDDDIAKTKGDKRFSYITAEGEEVLTYNKEKVSELEKQRTDMLKQYERDDLKKSIQDEITRLEKARTDKIEILRKEIEDTKTRYDQLIATEEIKWNGLIESAKKGTLEFDTLMNEFYGASLINLQSYVAESQSQIQAIKDAYASLASLEVTLPSTSGGGGGSSGGSSGGNVASASNPLGMSEKDFDKYVANKDKRESGKDVGGSAKKENQALRDKYGIDLDNYSFDDLKKYHNGGIVGKSPSRLAELTNKLFNVKPGEQVVKSLIGELQVPPQNFSNLFTNLNAMLGTIQLPSPPKLPHLNMSNQQQPSGDTIHLNGVVIKADNPNQFFKDLDLHIRMNKS